VRETVICLHCGESTPGEAFCPCEFTIDEPIRRDDYIRPPIDILRQSRDESLIAALKRPSKRRQITLDREKPKIQRWIGSDDPLLKAVALVLIGGLANHRETATSPDMKFVFRGTLPRLPMCNACANGERALTPFNCRSHWLNDQTFFALVPDGIVTAEIGDRIRVERAIKHYYPAITRREVVGWAQDRIREIEHATGMPFDVVKRAMLEVAA
jgi:hypothetical protein